MPPVLRSRTWSSTSARISVADFTCSTEVSLIRAIRRRSLAMPSKGGGDSLAASACSCQREAVGHACDVVGRILDGVPVLVDEVLEDAPDGRADVRVLLLQVDALE